MRLFFSVMILMIFSVTQAAQTDPFFCRDILAEIARQHALICADTDLSTACLGDEATVAMRPDADTLTQLDQLAAIGAGGFDPDNGVYGLAHLHLRTGALDGVTMLPFGAVIVENQSSMSADFVLLDVHIGRDGALVRQLPQADGEVIGAVYFGDVAPVVARTEDGAWLRVILSDDQAGWINAGTVIGNPPLDMLQTLTPDQVFVPPYVAPFQSINMTLGETLSDCHDTIPAGVLLQTPELEQNSAFIMINGARIRFVGTILVQFLPKDDLLTVDVVEGVAVLDDLQLEAGEQGRVGRDADSGLYTRYPVAARVSAWYRVNTAPLRALPRPVALPFNTEGLLTPFEPGTGFLGDVLVTDPCVIVWTDSVNIRSGPGTNYPVQAGVLENLSANAEARAEGTDGRVWWRLVPGAWILADNTVFGGDCASLPFVQVEDTAP